MKYTNRLGLLLFFFSISYLPLFGQSWQQNDLIFNPSGIPSLPFSQPRFADLDHDGDFEMILGSLDEGPIYYENTGSATNPKFNENPTVLGSISSTAAEMGVFADLDNDGDLDFIAGGYSGLSFYENLGDAYNPFFENPVDLFGALQVGASPVPSFADVDADGDQDMVVGLSESGLLKLYINSGSADSAVFSEPADQELADVGLYAYPYFFDFDNDHDFDLLSGRDGFGFYYFKNTGDSANPVWQQDNAPFNGLASTTYWNSPCLVDLSGDGKTDIIYGTSSGPLYYYRNTGSPSSPVWTQNTSLFGGVIDVGGASSPFFIDFDYDGDLDMVSGSNLGNIKYYRNTGTASGPAWQEASSYFSSIKHSIYSAITLADVNGDSLPDAVAGDLNGGFFFHRNTGTGFAYESTVFTGVDIGDWSAPKLVDLDYDGDFDIVAGNETGNLFYFENTGRPDSASWTEIPQYFGSIDVGSHSVPALTDLDQDGDMDLVAGNISGDVRYFKNDRGNWIETPEMVSGVSGGQNTAPAFADLNGDGKADLVLGNYSGTLNYFENKMETSIFEKPSVSLPDELTLDPVYPNPFNSTVSFRGTIAKPAELLLEVFDIRGRKIFSIPPKEFAPGSFLLNIQFPQSIAGGIFFYLLQTKDRTVGSLHTGKLIYLK